MIPEPARELSETRNLSYRWIVKIVETTNQKDRGHLCLQGKQGKQDGKRRENDEGSPKREEEEATISR